MGVKIFKTLKCLVNYLITNNLLYSFGSDHHYKVIKCTCLRVIFCDSLNSSYQASTPHKTFWQPIVIGTVVSDCVVAATMKWMPSLVILILSINILVTPVSSHQL